MRKLIEEDLIPDDVTIQVLTQSRDELIRRTFESVRGAKRAIVHLYNATAPLFRRVVFGKDKAGIVDIAVNGAKLLQANAQPSSRTPTGATSIRPRRFTMTELDFAKEICEAVMDVWEPTPQKPVILNLPATVEVATPEHLRRPDRVDVSQPHAARQRACSACIRTTIAAPASRPPNWRSWPAPTASKAACSATANAPATSAW